MSDLTKETEIFEVFIPSNMDAKGRQFGYIVGLREVEQGCAAWVQRGVKEVKGFKDFGVVQRSRLFDSCEDAKTWAYATARERIEKLK